MRKHAASYLKGIAGSAAIKQRLVLAVKRDEYERALVDL